MQLSIYHNHKSFDHFNIVYSHVSIFEAIFEICTCLSDFTFIIHSNMFPCFHEIVVISS